MLGRRSTQQPQSRPPAQPPPAMRGSGGEDSLPGAMQPGRYAFWPKRLPGAASRRSFPQVKLVSSVPSASAGGGMGLSTVSFQGRALGQSTGSRGGGGGLGRGFR